jgi:penicillin-insensitive murein endopeptidase
MMFLSLGVLMLAAAPKGPALSFGEGGCGKLRGGVALPCTGKNFEAHAGAACTLKRNFLHPLVQQTVVEAYASLTPLPRQWQYGEMGKPAGGPFPPHKTHQNGLSADFFVPVRDAEGKPTTLPINPLNKFGYALELDKDGKVEGLSVDFRSIADHLLALESAGKAHGVELERIILTPDFHARLFSEAPALKRLAPLFMLKEAWVRHDEHYHVDFKIPLSLRRPLSCSRK